MSSYPLPATPASLPSLAQSFAQQPGLPFAEVLSEQTIAQAACRHHVHFATGPDDVWNLSLTLWTFLTQCLSQAKDCASAVARAIVWRLQHNLDAPSANTGAYCKARAKLPLPLLQELTRHSGQTLEQQAPADWRWHDRRVLLLDGTTATLPDTPANQQAYPQSKQQQPGLGFPMLRMVVLLTFATAALLDAVVGPCAGQGTSELAQFRQLLGTLRPRDVLVADRHYCAYWLVAWLLERGADVVVRLHGRRHLQRRQSYRLGQDDWLIRWERPVRYAWMDEATWQQLPEFLVLRLVRVRVRQPGCRTRLIKVVTTLGGPDVSKDDIADLYHWRWHVELDIRNIKSTLNMKCLRCKTPALADKEVWTQLLGYNLLRTVLAQAAQAGGCRPRQLSFAAACHAWQEFRVLLQATTGAAYLLQVQALWQVLLVQRVGQRPGRVEPRRLKHWQHKYTRLMCPREQARAQLLGDAASQ
jgi:putative transposase